MIPAPTPVLRTQRFRQSAALSLVVSMGINAGCVPAIWGNGHVVQESRSTARDVTRISISDGLDLAATVDPTIRAPTLVVRTDRNLLNYVVTEIQGDTLHIYSSADRWLHGSDGVRIEVRMPALVDVQASGGSDANVHVAAGTRFTAHASGGSDLFVDGSFDELTVSASGGSDIKLSGRAAFAAFHVSGGSDLRANGCVVADADVQASGGSDVAVCVTSTLSGAISGGSDLSYRCHPQVVEIDSSGGSDLHRRD